MSTSDVTTLINEKMTLPGIQSSWQRSKGLQVGHKNMQALLIHNEARGDGVFYSRSRLNGLIPQEWEETMGAAWRVET